ncbi:MAG TPA: DinB family protein [Acidimicrobiales bacterium]|nr:DinB family protein [Acidimicrobiales bacterium]
MPGPDRLVIERLRATVRDLVSLTSGVPEDHLTREPAPGEWPVDMVVAHLADAEMVWGMRLRQILTSDDPDLPGFDQDVWADRFGGLDEEVHLSLARWRALREANLRVFHSMDEHEWEYAGMHEERGRITVADLADILADHDRQHLDQIRQALR